MASVFRSPIVTPRVDIILVVLSFVTGLLDSTVYNAFSVFASMQTGNTIFLSLGASDQPLNRPFGWLKSLLSIGSFAFGSFLTGRIANMSPRHYASTSRGSLCISFLIQAGIVVLAAGLLQGHELPEKAVSGEFEVNQLGAVAMVAFQAGAQMATSRLLGIKEIPTCVLTSVFTDLVMDPKLFTNMRTLRDSSRNRKIGTIVALLVGGICGGWISRSKAGVPGGLWVIAGIKGLVALSWWAFRGDALGPPKGRENEPVVKETRSPPVEQATEKELEAEADLKGPEALV